jgi:hypothetical protein
MTLKDLLKGPGKHKEEGDSDCPPPNFTFIRTTTNSRELIEPPSCAEDGSPAPESPSQSSPGRLSRFRSSSNASKTSIKSEKRLSSILHIRPRSRSGSHSRKSSLTSIKVPTDLPQINGQDASEDQEAKWEERATMLAQEVAALRSRSNIVGNNKLTTVQSETESSVRAHNDDRPGMSRQVSDAISDVKTHCYLGTEALS